MKLKGEIGMSRPSVPDWNEEEYVSIEIKDENSFSTFVRVQIKLADFARMLTGQWGIPVEFEVSHLDRVGKTRESKPLVFEMPEHKWCDKEFARGKAITEADPGWTADLYFGSQSSFFEENGKRYARTQQIRFV